MSRTDSRNGMFFAEIKFIFNEGKIVRLVREHYLRSDILCQSSICKICPNVNNILSDPKKESKGHYIIFGADVLQNFLELLELSEFKNIIFLQTAVQIVQFVPLYFFQKTCCQTDFVVHTLMNCYFPKIQEKSHKLYQRLRFVLLFFIDLFNLLLYVLIYTWICLFICMYVWISEQ